MKMRFTRLMLGVAATLIALSSPLWAKTARGVVVNGDGKPVKGATVMLQGQDRLPIRSYISQDDGTFQFNGLNPDGYYTLKARVGEAESKGVEIGKFDDTANKTIELKVPTK